MMMQSTTPPVPLTRYQSRLFSILADGQWHQRPALLEAVTGRRFASESVVANHIMKLRAKIEPHGYRIESGHRPGVGGWRLVRGSDHAPAIGGAS